MNKLTNSSLWKKLEKQYILKKDIPLRKLFDDDPKRFKQFSIRFEEMLFDFSKNHIDDEILPILLLLAEKSQLRLAITKLFFGGKINNTEKRAVLHTALRNKSGKAVLVDNENIIPKIATVLSQMKEFSESIHNGTYRSATDKPFDTIVNIGIGGSHLGPEMVCTALKKYAIKGVKIHFVSNIDPSDISEVFELIDPETTLFVIASKTFTTQETITNANTAKLLMKKMLGENANVDKHFVAVSTNYKECLEFGIPEERVFPFWDWVGGRYSLWSAIGLPIVLYLGYSNFDQLLTGAYKMDEHFRSSPFIENIPVYMALIDIWYTGFYHTKSRAIIPYDKYLKLFPAFLQQLEMESNGKRIDIEGNKVEYDTGQVIFGSAGTDSQHSFFQLLHQGTQIIPIDFLCACNSQNPIGDHHKILFANLTAQAEAFMRGKTETEALIELENNNTVSDDILNLLPNKVFPGSKPVTTILYKKLDPETLGKLIALYEHKVFVQGIIWNINSFDQWGVELGKQLASTILADLKSNVNLNTHDCSTLGLIDFFREMKDDEN